MQMPILPSEMRFETSLYWKENPLQFPTKPTNFGKHVVGSIGMWVVLATQKTQVVDHFSWPVVVKSCNPSSVLQIYCLTLMSFLTGNVFRRLIVGVVDLFLL